MFHSVSPAFTTYHPGGSTGVPALSQVRNCALVRMRLRSAPAIWAWLRFAARDDGLLLATAFGSLALPAAGAWPALGGGSRLDDPCATLPGPSTSGALTAFAAARRLAASLAFSSARRRASSRRSRASSA